MKDLIRWIFKNPIHLWKFSGSVKKVCRTLDGNNDARAEKLPDARFRRPSAPSGYRKRLEYFLVAAAGSPTDPAVPQHKRSRLQQNKAKEHIERPRSPTRREDLLTLLEEASTEMEAELRTAESRIKVHESSFPDLERLARVCEELEAEHQKQMRDKDMRFDIEHNLFRLEVEGKNNRPAGLGAVKNQLQQAKEELNREMEQLEQASEQHRRELEALNREKEKLDREKEKLDREKEELSLLNAALSAELQQVKNAAVSKNELEKYVFTTGGRC